ncbi:hypothetical protein [Actinomadura sp. 6N118]|uniref:hypothetical protein n=1 Tax=Actinomadura sp. 6N118 TaxID=3375151 RepID=UPI0037A1B52E
MSFIRKTVSIALATVTATFVLASPAAASRNLGWLYTDNRGGAVFFDADLNDTAGLEKITVCDNASNGWGVRAVVDDFDGVGSYTVEDPSNDGHCKAIQGQFFTEEHRIDVMVYEYRGSETRNLALGSGVS